MNKNESYFEDIRKNYDYENLIKEFKDGNIVILKKSSENKITSENFNLMVLEDELNIVFFKSFLSDKFILLRGADKLNSLLEFSEDILDKYKWRIRIKIIYGMKERENPIEFYKRIKIIYGVSIGEFLENFKEGGN